MPQPAQICERAANGSGRSHLSLFTYNRFGELRPADRTGMTTNRSHRIVNVRIKRVYEAAGDKDGVRILVDRLWPRGLSKTAARVDVWLKDIAPSDELRRWFDHEAEKWPEFQRRYADELGLAADAVSRLTALMARGPVTLLFGSRDLVHNNAVALAAYLATGRPQRRTQTSTQASRASRST